MPLISMLCVSLSVWLASHRADRQTAGFSVNPMLSCALHTFGIKSPVQQARVTVPDDESRNEE